MTYLCYSDLQLSASANAPLLVLLSSVFIAWLLGNLAYALFIWVFPAY
jgi:hypothetical protein